MHAGEFDFGHVTGHALFAAHRTGVGVAASGVPITQDDAEKLFGGFENLIEELPAWQPFAALIEGNRAVSVCRSVRITAEAHEAGVETLPDFRGKGYALDVTAAWAQRVWSNGLVPLYSTSWDNTASQAVARKLRLRCYGADFEII